jgi:prepilin-type N-terminal cleavage/methylation domain-containing protein
MSRLKVSSGFTLVELLVVISIIGVLVGLLIPAVQSAREAARSMSCRNNLSQLSMGIANRETALKELPGYINNLGQRGTRQQVRASWVVMLLPYIEQQALAESWSFGRVPIEGGKLGRQSSAYLDLLICPSDPPTSKEGPSLSYVANAGCLQRSQSSCTNGFTPNSNSPYQQVGENPANGLFFDRSRHIEGPDDQTGPPDFNGINVRGQISMNTAYVQAKGDGTTNTLMLSENTRVVHWAFVDGVEYEDGPVSTNGATADDKQHFGFLWEQPEQVASAINSGSSPVKEMRINGGADEEHESYTRIKDIRPEDGFPASNHPGGVNVVFMGSAVQFLSDQIDLLVYAQLMTCNRKRTDLQMGGVFEKDLPPANASDY